jgi:hypothetical protein
MADVVAGAPSLILSSKRQKRLQMLYGAGFPDPDGKDKQKLAEGYEQWLKGKIQQQHSVMMDKRLHWARHRLFRQGHQWISTRDGHRWREVNADENRVRAVFNMIGPALAFRLALLQEQRPGFKHMPISGSGVKGRETALAQQSVVEWHFQTQQIWPLCIEALSNAQTDGVSFLNVYLDGDLGPMLENVDLLSEEDERFEEYANRGYRIRPSGLLELPLGTSDEPLDPGQEAAKVPAGEIRTKLLLAHEVWADPEARCINGPDREAQWVLVRRIRDLGSARVQLDDPKLVADVEQSSADPLDVFGLDQHTRWQRGLPPFPGTRMRLPDGGVYENMVYLRPSAEFPEGKWIELVGGRHMREGDLPGRCIPLARFTDGSGDGDLFPRPEMSDWLGDQTSINGLGSKILEYSRLHSGTQLMAMEGTVISETWTDIVGSIVQYKGPKPDHMPAPRVSSDVWQMWVTMIRQLEDKTGWNSMARGQLTGEGGFQDVAGRAVLAARELFERQFGPMVRAAARGTSDWSSLLVRYAQYAYKLPRLVPMAGRPDLAKRISSEHLEGLPSVYVEPETLQPLPRALRNQLLQDYLQNGLISVQEFKKRAPFAEIRDLDMGDTDQWARAQQVNTLLEERWEEYEKMDPLEFYSASSGLGIFWQDDTEMHLTALEELILDDTQPFSLRKMAADRWGIYMELQRSKDFPAELEMQGMQRPPAPIEVLGVPNFVPQSPQPSQQQMAGPGEGGAGGLGAPQSASPAPDMAGGASGPPSAYGDTAQPLGELGAIEAGLG